MNARPHDDVAVILLAPAASAPTVALIEECSDSTGMNSVSISPLAIYVDTIWGISVEGVIGNAGMTSGLTWRIANATASFPDIRSFLDIYYLLLHCYRTERARFFAYAASLAVVKIKVIASSFLYRDTSVGTYRCA